MRAKRYKVYLFTVKMEPWVDIQTVLGIEYCLNVYLSAYILQEKKKGTFLSGQQIPSHICCADKRNSRSHLTCQNIQAVQFWQLRGCPVRVRMTKNNGGHCLCSSARGERGIRVLCSLNRDRQRVRSLSIPI